jgi:tetratricopeptide (TPR) repeat protein
MNKYKHTSYINADKYVNNLNRKPMEVLPDIFHSASKDDQPDAILDVHSNQSWVEFVAHLSKFNQLTPPDTKEQLELLLKNESDPEKAAALYAGIGKCHVENGDFISATKIFSYAYSLLGKRNSDTKAFILLEMVAFLAIINNHVQALMILKTIPSLTSSEYLLNIANYYELVHTARKGSRDVLNELKASALYFKKVNSHATLAYHYKNIGNEYRKANEFDTAMNYYKKAIQIAKDNGYDHIKANLYHDIGMWKYHQGDFQGAIKSLHQSSNIASSAYTRSFSMANIGYLYLHQNNYEIGYQYFLNALEIASNEGVFYLIPGVCTYLGMCTEKQSDFISAKHYYEKAYQAAFELIENNFECKGDIKRAIKAYVPFLERRNQKPEELLMSGKKNVKKYDFAIDKSLEDIRGIFQSSLFKILEKDCKSQRGMAKKLGIAERTYYVVKERINDYLNDEIPIEVENFIVNNSHLNWKTMNRKFETEVITHLFSEYKFSKKSLAEKLHISYPGVLQITKRIEDEQEMRGENK